ncbi:MAG: SulP family inorganic anion transporter, partial [Acidimicrobiia bacterium]|nr:SulP family inorganic anion transporter [Acidimicrobiia bacterium]
MSDTRVTGEGGPSAPTSSGVALGAGVVVGLLVVVMSASYASLIFRGPLADRLPLGVAILLASAVVHAVVLAFTSRFEGLVARPQSPIVPILGLMAAAIVVAVPEGSSDDTVLATVVAALIVASLLTGGVVGAIGVFGLGRFIRFIPHPVIGGFLAGSGYLLLRGGLQVLLESDVLVGAGDAWVDRWEVWVPGILFALLTTVVLRRSRHPLALPALIVGGIGLFYAAALVAGVDFAEVRAAGWFLVDIDGRTLWQGIDASLLDDVEWLVVAAQWPSFATVALVSAVSVLLTLTAMELQTGNDADLDRELRSAGLSNVLAGLAGGVVGYHSLSLSTLAGKLGARSRAIGIVVALVAAGALFVDARPIGLVPVWLVGGLLCYLGIEFLIEWLWEARRTLTRGDFLVVVLIVVTTGLVGYIQAIGLGVVLAVVLFVVKYSRVDAVKHLLSGRDHRSNVERPRADRELLRVHGDRIRLIVLQGFVFFGTASRVLESVRAMFLEPESMHPSYLVVDFRRVTGMDSSATMSLAKLLRLAGTHDCVVVLSGLEGDLRRQVEASEVGPFDPVILKDLD